MKNEKNINELFTLIWVKKVFIIIPTLSVFLLVFFVHIYKEITSDKSIFYYLRFNSPSFETVQYYRNLTPKILEDISLKFNLKLSDLIQNVTVNSYNPMIKSLHKKYDILINRPGMSVADYELVNKQYIRELEKKSLETLEIKVNYTRLNVSEEIAKKIAIKIPELWINEVPAASTKMPKTFEIKPLNFLNKEPKRVYYPLLNNYILSYSKYLKEVLIFLKTHNESLTNEYLTISFELEKIVKDLEFVQKLLLKHYICNLSSPTCLDDWKRSILNYQTKYKINEAFLKNLNKSYKKKLDLGYPFYIVDTKKEETKILETQQILEDYKNNIASLQSIISEHLFYIKIYKNYPKKIRENLNKINEKIILVNFKLKNIDLIVKKNSPDRSFVLMSIPYNDQNLFTKDFFYNSLIALIFSLVFSTLITILFNLKKIR